MKTIARLFLALTAPLFGQGLPLTSPISAGSSGGGGAILYNASQSLTSGQQAQALNNIGLPVPTTSSTTPATAPASLTFTKQATNEWFGLMDPALLTANISFGNALQQHASASNTGTITYGNGQMSFTPSSSAWAIYFPQRWKTPCLAIAAVITKNDGTSGMQTGGTTNLLNIGFKKSGASTYCYAQFDTAALTLNLAWAENGYSGGANHTQTGVTLSAAPYAIGFSWTAETGAVWYKKSSTSPWQIACTAAVSLPNSTIDLRVPATEANIAPHIGGSWSSQGTGAYTFSNIQIGAPQGIGIANQSFITYEDGTPIQKGNEVFFCCSRPFPSDSVNGGQFEIETSNFAVMALNLTTWQLRTVCQPAFARLSSNTSAIKNYCENAGQVIFDRTKGKWVWLVPSWGGETVSTGGKVQVFEYETAQMPTGSPVIGGATMLALPPANDGTNNVFDPAIVLSSGIYYMGYATNSGSLSTRLATATSITGTWTAVANSPVANGDEGIKLWTVGRTPYFASADNSSIHIYDLTLTSAGSFSNPSGSFSPQPAAHLAIVPVTVDGLNTVYLAFTFDATLYLTNNFSNGNAVFFTSQSVSGVEFPPVSPPVGL